MAWKSISRAWSSESKTRSSLICWMVWFSRNYWRKRCSVSRSVFVVWERCSTRSLRRRMKLLSPISTIASMVLKLSILNRLRFSLHCFSIILTISNSFSCADGLCENSSFRMLVHRFWFFRQLRIALAAKCVWAALSKMMKRSLIRREWHSFRNFGSNLARKKSSMLKLLRLQT